MDKSAYELAEKIEWGCNDLSEHGETSMDCDFETLRLIANMLRQQADRIAELEKYRDILEKDVIAKADRIAKLESCDKPVCWIREDGVVAFHEKPHIDSQDFKWFPLYITPQTKPRLSDEEIREIASQIDLESGVAQWKYDFARAIEKEHKIV